MNALLKSSYRSSLSTYSRLSHHMTVSSSLRMLSSGILLPIHTPYRCNNVSPASYASSSYKVRLFSVDESSSIVQDTTNINKLSEKIDYYSIKNDNKLEYGEFSTIVASIDPCKVGNREFVDVSAINRSMVTINTSSYVYPPKLIWLRGRVHSIRAKGNACFVVIRAECFDTIQCVHFKDKNAPELSKQLIRYVGNEVTLESIVDILGVVVPAVVKSCSQNDVEVQIKKIFVVSKAPVVLPFSQEDASRSQEEIDMSQSTDRPFPFIPQDTRLNNRWLDLRVPANNAIMRVRSGIMRLFREALYEEGFHEISSPKLIPGASEGGSEVFRLDYFGQPACLAQSPQLYKQMAISADLDRVFEVGPVFRAENSNTRRHLCEFTGLDIEMAIHDHYNEVLHVCHKMFKHIFTGLEERYANELRIIRQQYPSDPIRFTEQPLIIHWSDAMKLLSEHHIIVDEYDDLSAAVELQLGNLIKMKYDADFFILDQYPAKIRPFYTMPSQDNPLYSNSYDMFIRGQEICSGAQRCHDVEMLEQRIKDKGMELEPFKFYIESFKHGVSPHAGAGIGLERVVFLYLGLDNVRKASLFPRDPNRCAP